MIISTSKSWLLTALLCISLMAGAQQRANAVFHEVKNKEVVQSLFPKAEKIEKENNYWFRILDGSKNLLGYAMSSMPFCKDVTGYNDNTPVMIITDAKLKIIKIALLSNWETASYVQKLETKGFFKLWDNKNVKQAQKVQIDGYTGATMTAKAVDKNVQFLLDNGLKNLPEKK